MARTLSLARLGPPPVNQEPDAKEGAIYGQTQSEGLGEQKGRLDCVVAAWAWRASEDLSDDAEDLRQKDQKGQGTAEYQRKGLGPEGDDESFLRWFEVLRNALGRFFQCVHNGLVPNAEQDGEHSQEEAGGGNQIRKFFRLGHGWGFSSEP